VKQDGGRRRRHMDWEAIFHGSRHKISTLIIGCEADFRGRKRISPEEASKLIRRLKDHVNVSYESETTIAKQIGVDGGALSGWLVGKVKPTFQSLLKVREFLERQAETRGGIAPIGYVPIRGNNPNGRRGGRAK
jgi:hypothetical protein